MKPISLAERPTRQQLGIPDDAVLLTELDIDEKVWCGTVYATVSMRPSHNPKVEIFEVTADWVQPAGWARIVHKPQVVLDAHPLYTVEALQRLILMVTSMTSATKDDPILETATLDISGTPKIHTKVQT